MLSLNSLPTTKYLLKYLLFIFVVVHCNIFVAVHCDQDDSSEPYPKDYLCNNGTTFACICYQKDNSLIRNFTPCSVFIGQSALPVVKIVLNATNLENKIKTSKGHESYENYFKRRIIGATLTTYCENSTNECLNTMLPIQTNRIVLLKISCGAQRLSEIYYVVTQQLAQNILTSRNTMSPTKIIQIINARLKVKPILLGHAKLVSHEKDYIDSSHFLTDAFNKTVNGVDGSSDGDERSPNSADPNDDTSGDYFARNMAFFIVIIVLGIIVGIIYFIAIIKAVSDRKKQIKRMKDKEKYEENSPTNYGATNNGESQSSPFLKATVVSLDADKKITSSSSSYDDLIEKPTQEQKNLSSTSFTRIVVNHPPPTAKPRSSLFKTKRTPKKTISNENLIENDSKTFKFNSIVKKSKTVHEIGLDFDDTGAGGVHNDNIVFFPKTNDNEVKFDDDANEFRQIKNQPEIRVEMATSDDDVDADADVDDEENRTQENTKAAELLTMSQTEENLLQSETSSVNEFSTESDSDSEILSDQNLHPSSSTAANYQPLKESNWSINRSVHDEDTN